MGPEFAPPPFSFNLIFKVAVYSALEKWGWLSLLLPTYSMDVSEYPIPHLFSRGFLPHSLSLSLYYDVNRTGRSKAVTIYPHFPRALNTATIT